ncbi:MAG: DUF4340 domain-containing protein [Bacteroidales bacterium]|nr:DUF4340 domain-containing protein [Bacteroidales bacterium]
MSKILNTKALIIILVIVAGLYFVSTLFEKKERTFKSELVTVDTADITKIMVIPKSGEQDALVMQRTGQTWTLEQGGKTYNPDRFAARNILMELIKLKPERVAAKDESRWDELQVSDSTSTRVKLFDGKKEVADVYIGKFNYQQPPQGQQQMMGQQQNRGKMSTHVRLAGEDEVYVVDGFIKMNIQSDVSNYRDKTLSLVPNNDITKVTFNYPNDNFTLMLRDSLWTIGGVLSDSAATVQYLASIGRITSTDFVDDAMPMSNTPAFFVKIEGNNILPIELKAYPADTVNQFLITSSINQGAKFSGAKAGLFDKIFKPKGNFLKTGEK